MNFFISGGTGGIGSALPLMLAQGYGAIAVISSAAALNGFAQTPAYFASKAAVTILCESLSLRYADRNISVSAILPGYVDTPLARATHHDLDQMPFLMNVDKAADMIMSAIEKRKMRYIFPWQIRFVSSLFSALPRPLFRAVFKWSEK